MRTVLFLCSPLLTAGFWGVTPDKRLGFIPAPVCSRSARAHVRRSGSTPAAVVEMARSRPMIWRLMMSETVEAEPAPAEAEEKAAGEKEKGGRKKRTPLADLSVGAEFAGKIRTIKDFGVFVDIGAESDGLVHISQMSAAFVSNPADIAKIGDSVTVRVLNVDTEKKQIGLTMKTEAESAAPRPAKRGGKSQKKREEDATEEGEDEDGEDRSVLDAAPAGEKDVSAFENFDPKAFIKGEVVSVQQYGAFVRLEGTDVDGLLPVGDMQGKLKVGEKVEVRITDVDTERKRLTLSNAPLLRGKRTRFAGNKGEEDELVTIAKRSGLYASELPDEFETRDDDADWESAFAFGEEAGFEGGEEDADAGGEGAEEDDGLDTVGSINRFRSPAWKKERGLLPADDDDKSPSFKYAAEDAPDMLLGDDDDEDDTAAASAYFKQYESQIPQLGEDEIKALIRKAQGTRRNVTEEWLEEQAEEKEYVMVDLTPSKKKGDYSMLMKGVTVVSVDEVNKKPRVPIYFSKKVSKLKQVEILEELEKITQEDPLALAGRTAPQPAAAP